MAPRRADDTRTFERWRIDEESIVGSIEAAIERLVRADQMELFRHAASCPWPPFGVANVLLANASGVLRGNPQAAKRFDETIDLLRTAGARAESLAPRRQGPEHVHRETALFPEAPALRLLLASAVRDSTRLASASEPSGLSLTAGLLADIEFHLKLEDLALRSSTEPHAAALLVSVLRGMVPECGPWPIPGVPDLPPRLRIQPGSASSCHAGSSSRPAASLDMRSPR